VEPANKSDANAVLPAIKETKERGCKPEKLLADTAYGSDENVAAAAEEGVELLSPVHGSGVKCDRIELKEFEWNLDEKRPCKCPEGQESKERYQTESGTHRVVFDREICAICRQRKRCPVKINSKSSRLRYRPKQARLAERRAYEKTDEFRRRYRWRAGIEATMSRYKSLTGSGRVRYRGLSRVTFAATLKALGLNIHRAARAAAARLRAQSWPGGPCTVILGVFFNLGRSFRIFGPRSRDFSRGWRPNVLITSHSAA
jgi:hypothetical protein